VSLDTEQKQRWRDALGGLDEKADLRSILREIERGERKATDVSFSRRAGGKRRRATDDALRG
jgi:hypothetical protein